jgi:hypothetical protein
MSTIKKATAFDIFLISFFALPLVYNSWTEVLIKIGANPCQVFWSLVALTVLYLAVVIVLGFDNYNKKRKEIAKDLIVGYLQSKNYKMMSFERIREKLNSNYSNEFLEKLVQEFPKEIRRAKLKDDKPGIGRVVVETSDEEEA